MEETNVKIKPKQPKIVTRVSNIENLQKSADDLNTTSRRIRRLFEKNTYQKRTQLSVLRRYKRRLDSIERAEEERKRKASKKKIPLPSIKKFAGSFFAPDASKDPLKAIGALAAFNSLSKISEGDILGAIGPGLVAAGMVAGPSLIGAGVSKIFEKKVPRGFDVTGRRVSKSTQQRYLSRYGEKAFKNRFGGQNLKGLQSQARPAVTSGGRTAKAFGRLGKSIIPGVGAVLGAVDAKMRADEGDVTGSRIAGASATLDTLAAASAATGIGIVATPFLGLASMTLDLVNFARDITGMSEAESKNKKSIQTKLEKQTKEQKKSVERKEERGVGLSFAKTLVGYERVVNKFEEFATNFKPTGVSLTDEVSLTDYSEPDEYSDDTGDYGAMGGTFESHIMEFRKFRNKQFGASEERFATASPRLYQIRELGIWEGGKQDNWRINPLADDTAYEKDEHAGAGHWENRAFDIPVPYRSAEGDKVAEFWKRKGYKVIWNTDPDHYTHVHVEVPKDKANDFFSGKLKQPKVTPKTPNPSSSSVQPVPGTKYTLRGTTLFKGNDGKYYSTEKGNNGKFLEVDKRNWEYVKKEGDLVSFSPRQRDINSYTSYESPSGVIALIQVPQPQPPQAVQQPSGTSIVNIGTGGGDALNRIRLEQIHSIG